MATRPDRTLADGVDLSEHIRSAAQLRAAGKTFAVRYVSPNTVNHPQKTLTAAEVADCAAHGVDLCVVWETNDNRALDGYGAGHADALAAAGVVRSLGLDPLPIHWAIDFDATGAQVEAYGRGWADAIGVARCGAYGGIRPLAYLLDRQLITYAWQTYAWSAGQLEPRATAYQWLNGQTVAGNSVDLDAALAHDFGQWPRPTNPGDGEIDMTEVDLTPAAQAALVTAILAAKVDAVPVGEQGIPGLTVRGALRQAAARTDRIANVDDPAEAATLAQIAAAVAALPAVIAALPGAGAGGTLTEVDVETAVATVLERTTAALTVAPPAAGSGS